MRLGVDQMHRKRMKKEWSISRMHPNLGHVQFLFGSSKILVQSVDGLLMFLRGGGHLLAFLSERSNLFSVAFDVVLQHLIPDGDGAGNFVRG